MKKKMIKFNWGTGILITCTIFILLITGIVIYFMNQDVELVSDNYYEKGIKYQQQVDKIQKTKEMNAEVDIYSSDKKITLKFPEGFTTSGITGDILLYRPSGAKNDYIIPLALNKLSSEQVITTDNLAKGLWTVKVNWQAGKDNFYTEKNVMLY